MLAAPRRVCGIGHQATILHCYIASGLMGATWAAWLSWTSVSLNPCDPGTVGAPARQDGGRGTSNSQRERLARARRAKRQMQQAEVIEIRSKESAAQGQRHARGTPPDAHHVETGRWRQQHRCQQYRRPREGGDDARLKRGSKRKDKWRNNRYTPCVAGFWWSDQRSPGSTLNVMSGAVKLSPCHPTV